MKTNVIFAPTPLYKISYSIRVILNTLSPPSNPSFIVKVVDLEGNPGNPPYFKLFSRLVFVGKIFLVDSSNQTSIPANPNR